MKSSKEDFAKNYKRTGKSEKEEFEQYYMAKYPQKDVVDEYAKSKKQKPDVQPSTEEKAKPATYVSSYLTGDELATQVQYGAGMQIMDQVASHKPAKKQENKKRDNLPGTLQMQYDHMWNVAHDKKYAQINTMNQPDFDEQAELGKQKPNVFSDSAYLEQPFFLRPFKKTEEQEAAEGRQYNYIRMTEDEEKVYNYLNGKYGGESANRYLKSISDELTRRDAGVYTKNMEEFSREHPVIGTAMDANNSVVSGLAYPLLLAKNAVGKQESLDPYTEPLFATEHMNEAIREGIKGNSTLKNIIKNDKVRNFTVDTGLSMTENVARLPFGTYGLGVAAGNAGMSATKDAAQRGGDLNQVMNAGLYQAAAEAFFEKFSLEGLKSLKTAPVKSARDFLKNLAKQSLTEGSEEVFTEIANTLSDNMIMGELSNYNLSLQAYMNKGMSEEDAKNKALTDILENIGMAGLGGAVSGGIMGSGAMALNGIDSYTSYADNGRELNPDYRDYSEGIDTNQERYNSYQDYQKAAELQKTAAEYAARQQNKENIGNYEKGRYEADLNEFMRDFAEHNSDNGAFREQQSTGPVERKTESIPEAIPKPAYEPVIEAEYQQNQGATDGLAPWAEVYGKNGKEAFKSAYDGNTGIETYYKAFSRYYNAGRYNMDMQEAKSMLSAVITSDQAAVAYKAGAQDRNLEIGYDPVTGKLRNMIQKEPKTGGLQSAVETATEAQKVVVDAFGKRTGLSFVLVDDIGSGAAASYEKGKVKISVNSKNFNASISHELTHFIQEYSPDLYEPYQEVAVKAMTRADSVSFDDLVESYSKSYERAGKRLTRAETIDEIVADATEKFFNDQEYVNEVVHANRTLGEKILDFLNDILDTIKSLMKTGSTRKASKALEENMESFEGARKIWMVALEEAGDRYKSGVELEEEKTDHRYQLQNIDGVEMEDEKVIFKDISQITRQQFTDMVKEFKRAGFTQYKNGMELKDSLNTMIDIFKEYDFGDERNDIAKKVLYSKKTKMEIKSLESLHETNQNEMYKKAVEYFGKTSDINEAGYLTLNGELLDFSDKKNGARSGKRNLDHREINDLYELNNIGDAMMRFINEGNIRLHPENGGINLAVKPNLKQKRALKNYIDSYDGKIYVDIMDKRGNNKESIEYPEGSKGTRILSDIDRYFDTGKVPEITMFQKFRYQLEDIDDYQDTYLELIHENDDLREGIKLLQREFELTDKSEMRQEDIHKISRKVLKTYNSTSNIETLERNLSRFYEIIRSPDQIDGKEVVGVAADIARSVLKNSQQVDNELTQEYKDLRKQIRETKIQITDQDKADLMEDGDYNSFRKRYFGKMKLGKDGISVDSFYEELSEQHPELFDRNITHPADRLKQIGNVIDLTQEQIINPYHANMDEMAYIVGQELIDSYFDVRNPKPTFADKKAAEVDRVKREYKKKVDNFKQSRITQYEAIIGEKNRDIRKLKDIHQQELAVQQQKFTKKMQSRRDAERSRNAKKRIVKEVNTMKTWLLKPNDSKHIPQELRGTVAEFLSSIDYSSDDPLVNRSKDWERAKNAMAAIRDSGEITDDSGVSHYMDIDPDMIGRFEELTKKVKGIDKLDDLDAYSMEELQKVVISMKKALTEVNALKSNKKSGEVSLLAEEVFQDLDSMKDRTEYTGVAVGTADKLFNYDMLDPQTMFGIMGGGMKSTYDSLRKGLDRKTLLLKAAADYIENLMKENGITQQDIRKIAGKDAESIKFQTAGGEVSLTIPQIMSLYELNKRNQARGHLYDRQGGIKPQSRARNAKISKGGIEPAKIEKSGRPARISVADVNRMTDTLTAEQKAFADGMQQFMGKEIASWGNQVSMEMYGYEKFTAKDYFPITTDKNYIVSQEGKAGNQSIRNLGMTKSVVEHAHNPLIIEDIFDVFTRQVDQMSSYNAYVVPLSDLHKVYNYMDMRGLNGSTIKEAIDRKFGREGGKYITKLVDDINGSVRQDRSIGEKFLSNMKAASVAGNLRVAIQQPTAYVRASMEINPKYLARGAATITEKGQWERICKYAPIAQWKDWGFYRMEVSRQMKDIIMGTDGRTQRFVNATMAGAEMGDKVAWNRLWRACEFECMDLHPNLQKGSEEFYTQVGERFSEIVDKTQVADSILHRTQIMRSENGFNKLATSFMAEPLKSYNMLYREAFSVTQKKKGAKMLLARAAGVYTANAFLTAVAASVIDAVRDDDKDKNWGEKYKENLRSNFLDGMNMLNNIPYVKDVVSIMQGYTPGRADLSAVQDIKYALDKIEKLYEGNSTLTPQYVTLYVAQACSKLTGIPIKSITREAEGLIGTAMSIIDGEADYTWTKQKYDIGNKGNLKMYTEIMVEAYKEGNQEFSRKIKEDLNRAGIDNESISTKIKGIIKAELINDEMVDPDVDRAASAIMEMDLSTYEEAYNNLKNAGYADKLIKSAIEKRVKQLSGDDEEEMDPEEELKTDQENLYEDILFSGESSSAYVSKYTLDDMRSAADLFDGKNMSTSKAFETAAGEIMKEKIAGGKKKKEAISEIRQVLTTRYKPLWQQGNSTERSKIMTKLKFLKVDGTYIYSGYDFGNWKEK